MHDGEEKQEANFTYLTGVESPYAICVAIPGEENNREILFLPEKYQFAGAQFPYDDDRFRDVSGASAIKCGSGRQNILNVGVSCSRTGPAERYRDFLS